MKTRDYDTIRLILEKSEIAKEKIKSETCMTNKDEQTLNLKLNSKEAHVISTLVTKARYRYAGILEKNSGLHTVYPKVVDIDERLHSSLIEEDEEKMSNQRSV